MKYFSIQPHLWDVEGAEKPLDVQARGLRAIRKIAAENDGKTIAIFSHGYIIRLMLAHLQGQSLEQVGETPTGDNTAVSLLEADGDSLRVIFRDDNSHLKTEAFLANEKIVKRANGLEPGLRYQPLDPETQAEFFADLVQENWNREAAFNREKLLSDAKDRQTLVSYRRDEPIGVIQLGDELGWISLICIREDMRKRGFGMQLIGQAVYRTRQMGGESLKIALMTEDPAVHFFEDSGFVLLTCEDGRSVYSKDIRFDPEFL
jgi:probable phosphoglycerate mutase